MWTKNCSRLRRWLLDWLRKKNLDVKKKIKASNNLKILKLWNLKPTAHFLHTFSNLILYSSTLTAFQGNKPGCLCKYLTLINRQVLPSQSRDWGFESGLQQYSICIIITLFIHHLKQFKCNKYLLINNKINDSKFFWYNK